MSKDGWSKKKSLKNNTATSKMEMENEWDAELLCILEQDELALMTMMGEHNDYENDLIVDPGYSMHMTVNPGGV